MELGARLFTSTCRTKVLIAVYSQDFNAKLGGFGLARNNGLETWETSVTTKIVGSFGYIAPEYMETGHVTTMCDIYSFGVFLLESITGRNAVDAQRPKKERNMVYWATHVGSNIKKIMDPRLEGKYPLHGASEYVALALNALLATPRIGLLLKKFCRV
ncbi:hypothetical protein E3N88_46209 [Mikania micrantha]|uniref:Protein kinase domain-containing protein n=1 Tax=Mikania micrantha TaxID=192012 RepID=A0A5N6L6Z4_9ASTR|nr:hypothetical protein E3N88_46209 [Mikania micrantha]